MARKSKKWSIGSVVGGLAAVLGVGGLTAWAIGTATDTGEVPGDDTDEGTEDDSWTLFEIWEYFTPLDEFGDLWDAADDALDESFQEGA